jgi:hypothetical protein
VRLAHANQLRFLSDAGADVTVMVSAASRRAASYESHRDQQKRDAQHDDDGRVRLDLRLPPPWRKESLLGKDCSIRSRPCCGPTRPGGDAVPPREAGAVGHLERRCDLQGSQVVTNPVTKSVTASRRNGPKSPRRRTAKPPYFHAKRERARERPSAPLTTFNPKVEVRILPGHSRCRGSPLAGEAVGHARTVVYRRRPGDRQTFGCNAA